MKSLFFILFTLIGVFCLFSLSQAAEMAEAVLADPDGRVTGQATLVETSEGVYITVAVKGIPTGWHAFHIHEKGECTGPDFNSAGGHFNPYGREHGARSVTGQHAGDLPNILIGPDGSAAVMVTAPNVTLKEGEVNSLFKEGGTAVVIHAQPDDYKSQPTGEAGARIACGVVRVLK